MFPLFWTPCKEQKRTKWTTQQFSNHLLLTQDFRRSKEAQNLASKIQQKGSVKKLSSPPNHILGGEKKKKRSNWEMEDPLGQLITRDV